MADWDPFTAEDDQPPIASSVAANVETAGNARISKDDMKIVADAIYKELEEVQTPWVQAPNPLPDLSWYTPTCSFDNWKHTCIKVERGEGIAYITLNRPAENNTITDAVRVALCDALFTLHLRKTEYRMVVFMAEGPIFCGGADPNEDGSGALKMAPPSKDAVAAQKALVERATKQGAFPDGVVNHGRLFNLKMWHTMNTLPQFTVALVAGSVMGDGLGLVCACDMSIAVKNSFFSLPEVKVGRVATLIMPYLIKKIGIGFAKRMVATGANMPAAKAKEISLVNEVVDAVEGGHALIKELAEVLTACGPRSVEAAKLLVQGVGGQPIQEGVMFYTAAMLAMVTVSSEATDGMRCVQVKEPKPWEKKPIAPIY